MNYKKFLIASTLFALGSGIAAPYLIIRINEIAGSAYLGIVMGIAILSQSLSSIVIGKYTLKRMNALIYAQITFSITVFLFSLNLLLYEIIFIQVVMGIVTAVHIVCSSVLIAEITKKENLGIRYGYFHSLQQVAVGAAMIIGGFLTVLLGINSIFFIGAIFIFCSALLLVSAKNVSHKIIL